ncbi:MAG: nuclear transport factor 2 family protein [Thermoleophilia bacterium]|nr:nuclear transport factor 2 family protein [Thermoleophilia bacterium]
MLAAYRDAVARDDDEALAACYAADCAWLTPDGPVHGRDGALARHRALRESLPAVTRVTFDRVEQQGAHAALWWTGRDDAGAVRATGMAVMEIRAGAIRFKADVAVPTPA